MVEMIYAILKSFVVGMIAYAVLVGFEQKAMAKLTVILTVLSISVAFLSWFVPVVNGAKAKIDNVGKNIEKFSNAVDKVGNGIDRITKPNDDVTKTKNGIDDLVEKTKVPYVDKVDQGIENWWSELWSDKEVKKNENH